MTARTWCLWLAMIAVVATVGSGVGAGLAPAPHGQRGFEAAPGTAPSVDDEGVPTAAAPPEPAGDDPGPLARIATASRAALTAAGFERLETEAAGRRLVLWRAGNGPHLVLLHGSGHQAGAWAAVAPGLTGSYTVHVVDLPGHGDSEPATGPLRMAEVVAGLEAYLATLDGPAVLVGNSFGAWLGTVYAHRHPERVSRLVLVNGGGLLNIPAEGLSLTPADREAARRVMAALRDPESPELPDEVLDDVVRRSASGPIGRMLQDPAGLMGHLLDGRLHEVTVPVDVIWGASDRLMPLAYAQRMVEQLPRARLTTLEVCGHIPAAECPTRFGNALRGVLAAPPPEPRSAAPEAPAATPATPPAAQPPAADGSGGR